MSNKVQVSLCYPCEAHRGDGDGPGWPSTANGFWDRLVSMDPIEVCADTGAFFSEGRYRVLSLDGEWFVDPSSRRVTSNGGASNPGWERDFPFLVLVYLATSVSKPLTGEMVPPRELFSGMDMFQQSLALQTGGLLERYGDRPSGLLTTGKIIGASQIEGADAGLRLLPFPRIPVELRLWAADDEFPADIVILLDSSTGLRFPADAISVMLNLLFDRLQH